MSRIFLILMTLISLSVFSQKKLPVIKANSPKAIMMEDGEPKSGWNVSPKIKLDVYTFKKSLTSKRITFKTDIDSISLNFKPGEKKDFIVLLNGKDSCYTRIQSPAMKNFSKVKPEIHDTIPFFINKYNTNFVNVVFKKTDSLILNFDTGATEVSLIPEALKKKVSSKPELYSKIYDFKIGNNIYKTEIYDIEMAGNEVDGLLGWTNFDGMIVELDYDKNKMIVHSKMLKSLKSDKSWEKFKIKYISGKPYIESELLQNKQSQKNLFMFDLGYQRTAMLDNDLLAENKFSTEDMTFVKKTIMHGAAGNEVLVNTLILEKLKMGKLQLKNVPVQVMSGKKPVEGFNVHILGSDVLKRFNTILDFQKHEIYLKPNHLYNGEFADAK